MNATNQSRVWRDTRRAALVCWLVAIAGSGARSAVTPGSVSGRITDPSGAAVPGAVIVLQEQNTGVSGRTVTDSTGHYHLGHLVPGSYTETVTADGFGQAAKQSVVITAGHQRREDFRLEIKAQAETVEVHGDTSAVQLAPENNASAVVISGENLNALSNDPDELQAQLQALAGPAVGPNGGEIYIDGFTRGDMPPKSAIREVRVNANPFSADNDRLGYGRIDIFTRPGGQKFHGSASAEYNDSSLNAESPFLIASGQKAPAYHTWLLDGNVGGPLGKKASFYFGIERRNINRASLVNTDILNSSFEIVPFVASVTNPRVLTNVNPRADFQLSATNTLTLNYRFFENREQNDGITSQALPQQAYEATRSHHNLQLGDTQVLGPNLLNTVRFQYLHFDDTETPNSTTPTLDVQGAFVGGGNTDGVINRHETHYQLQNYTSWAIKRHTVQLGGFVRDIARLESATSNFNGSFIFNSLSAYQQTERSLAQGLTMTAIQAAGYGPSQFQITAGTPAASINRIDGALFAADDWRLTPHLTASYGLRFESENVIHDHADFAPRFGLAWGLGHGSNTKTVLRAGSGIFYERFDDDQMIIAERLNGINQRTYVINKPTFYPTAPPVSALDGLTTSFPTIYRISHDLRSPYTMDLAASLERQVLKNVTASVTYLNARGSRQFLTNDINAPLPGTYDPSNPVSGMRPLGDAAGNVYEYQSRGIFRQNQFIANVNVNAGARLSLFGYYVFNDAHSDTAGVDFFPANPWNLLDDYGRAAYDIRKRTLIGGTYAIPFGMRLSGIVMANSGIPFSILLGKDLYGTGIFNSRPAAAGPLTPAGQVLASQYGAFNAATTATDIPIPPNTATGPANVIVNLRLSRTFGFGETEGSRHGGTDTASTNGRGERGGLGGRGLSGSGGHFGLSGATDRRYAVTLSISAMNAFNHVNFAPPVDVISSPLFGRPITLAGGSFSAQVGNPVANRVVNVEMEFSF